MSGKLVRGRHPFGATCSEGRLKSLLVAKEWLQRSCEPCYSLCAPQACSLEKDDRCEALRASVAGLAAALEKEFAARGDMVRSENARLTAQQALGRNGAEMQIGPEANEVGAVWMAAHAPTAAAGPAEAGAGDEQGPVLMNFYGAGSFEGSVGVAAAGLPVLQPGATSVTFPAADVGVMVLQRCLKRTGHYYGGSLTCNLELFATDAEDYEKGRLYVVRNQSADGEATWSGVIWQQWCCGYTMSVRWGQGCKENGRAVVLGCANAY